MKIPLPLAERSLRFSLQVADPILELVEKNRGSSHIPPAFEERLKLLHVTNWAEYYLDPRKTTLAAFLSEFSRKELEIIAYNYQIAESDEERSQLTEKLLNHIVDKGENPVVEIVPEPITEELQHKLVEFLNGLSDALKEEIGIQLHFTLANLIVSFYSTISIMAYGQHLTTLVKRAVDGDLDSLFMAYHVDKTILDLPPLAKRYKEAVEKGELRFLVKLAQLKEAPLLRQRILHRKLWFSFAFLEDFELLYSTKREELFDLCQRLGVYGTSPDEKDLDGFNSRLRTYRQYQQSNFKQAKRGRKSSR